MTLRIGTIALVFLAAATSSAFCEDAPKTSRDTEATDGPQDDVKSTAEPASKPRSNDIKRGESIDSGYEGG